MNEGEKRKDDNFILCLGRRNPISSQYNEAWRILADSAHIKLL